MSSYEALLEQVLKVRASLEPTEPFVVGINGLDCSGKTYTSHRLKSSLEGRNIKVKVLHIDDFNNQSVQSKNYNGYSDGYFSAEDLLEYYRSSIHYA